MANILDRYGIKEVADVTFYEINKSTGAIGKPVIYLDTLKVSTIEETASQTSARGGKGNPELIMWDYGREITVTLEDALFSAKSMALMFNQEGTTTALATGTSPEFIHRAVQIGAITDSQNSEATINGQTVTFSSIVYYDATGASTTEASATWADITYIPTHNAVIEVSAEQFPGTYYVVGDTYARSEISGTDEFFQFIIPKAKIMAGQTITMQAEGDPSTFSMNLKVLRPADGVMLKLVKYDFNEVAQG